MDSAGPELERRFRRDIAALDDVFAFVGEFFRARRLDPRHAPDVGFIVEELFTNMVKYDGGEHDIGVRLTHAGDRVRIAVIDEDVEPFDPTAVPEVDTTRPIAERGAGGLGLHLVRKLADGIDYEYKGRTSTVTVTKKLGE